MTEQLQFPTESRTVHHAKTTPVIHLDEYTREVGRAGVADARAILAACAPTVLGKDAGLSIRANRWEQRWRRHRMKDGTRTRAGIWTGSRSTTPIRGFPLQPDP